MQSAPLLHADFNPLNAKLNPMCHLLALLGAHHILHISRIRVNVYASKHSQCNYFQDNFYLKYSLSLFDHTVTVMLHKSR